MKRLLAAGVVAGLVGCMSLDTVEKRDPVLTAHTSKSAEDYVLCIQRKFINLTGADIIEEKWRTLVRSEDGAVVEVVPDAGHGAQVTLREPGITLYSMKGEVQECL